jgi:hypothetical protein
MHSADDPTEVAWPRFVAAESSLRTVLDGLHETERLPANGLLTGQSRQLKQLLRWIGRESRFYQNAGWVGEVLADLERRPDAFWKIWRRIPILAKSDLRAHGELIHSPNIPKNQTPIG